MTDLFDRYQKIAFVRMIRFFLYITALAVIGVGFTDHQTFFAGFILGFAIGFSSQIHLFVKVRRLVMAVKDQKKPSGLGMLFRFSMAALAAIIATSFPQYFDVIGVVIGLVLPIILATVDAIYFQVTQKP